MHVKSLIKDNPTQIIETLSTYQPVYSCAGHSGSTLSTKCTDKAN